MAMLLNFENLPDKPNIYSICTCVQKVLQIKTMINNTQICKNHCWQQQQQQQQQQQ
jgi:hypothetical protein